MEVQHAIAYLAPVAGYKPIEMSVIAMNRSDSYNYFLDKHFYTPGDLIGELLGFLPSVYGTTFSLVSTMQAIFTSVEISRVRDADGYAEIISSL